jgi:hypothetical protein
MSFDIKERHWGIALIVVSASFSLAGVAIGAFVTHQAVDGTRGGALALLVVLFAFFARRDMEPKVREAITEIGPKIETGLAMLDGTVTPSKTLVEKLQQQLDALTAAAQIQRVSEWKMNIRVGIAAAIGNLFWGFGDIFAHWIARTPLN